MTTPRYKSILLSDKDYQPNPTTPDPLTPPPISQRQKKMIAIAQKKLREQQNAYLQRKKQLHGEQIARLIDMDAKRSNYKVYNHSTVNLFQKKRKFEKDSDDDGEAGEMVGNVKIVGKAQRDQCWKYCLVGIVLLVAVWFYIPLVEGIWARYRRGWDSRVESGVDFYEENALRGKVSNYKFREDANIGRTDMQANDKLHATKQKIDNNQTFKVEK